MEQMKKLARKMFKKITSAKKYAKCAVDEMCCYPMMAKTFYDISADDVKHVGMLHTEIDRLMREAVDAGSWGDAEQAVYDYIHESYVQMMAEVKEYQTMYREG